MNNNQIFKLVYKNRAHGVESSIYEIESYSYQNINQISIYIFEFDFEFIFLLYSIRITLYHYAQHSDLQISLRKT